MIAVVVLRRSDDPWARSIAAYLWLAAFVLGIRLLFGIFMGAGTGETVLFTLPELPLPDWAAGIQLGGAVTAEGLAWTVYDALRLAVMLLCLGAANALANPRRALRVVPAALYEASVAIVIALSVAPQLIESTARVRRAQRLRGASSGVKAAGRIIVPVLADAIDRSLGLAASMESRGFGRTRGNRPAGAGLTVLLTASSLLTVCGGFLVLSWPGAAAAGLATAVVGVVATVWGLRRSGRRLQVTRYRPDPWTPRDTALVATGVSCAVLAAWLSMTAHRLLNPSTDPLTWPTLTPTMLLLAALVAAPIALTRAPRPAVVTA